MKKVQVRFNQHDWHETTPARMITDRERAVLAFMITRLISGYDELLGQLAAACVTMECRHCASIILTVDQAVTQPSPFAVRVPMMAESKDTDGMSCQLLLHIVEGYLDELEIWRGDPGPIRALPDPDSLTITYLVQSLN